MRLPRQAHLTAKAISHRGLQPWARPSQLQHRWVPRRASVARLQRSPLTARHSSSSSSRANQHIPKRTLPAAILVSSLLIWSLYPSGTISQLRPASRKDLLGKDASKEPESPEESKDDEARSNDLAGKSESSGAWFNFSNAFQSSIIISDEEWRNLSDKVLGFIIPEWTRLLPAYIRKLQRELSMAPGSLADEIWQEAHDSEINPEIRYSATVRVSHELCDEEKEYLARRKKIAAVALARYLGLEENDVHQEDVPTIAMCGSGGGLRALVAGTGSMLATEEDGLFDCVTYTSGVSGSCWLQALYHSSFADGSLTRVLEHLRSRLDVHIAYPPAAFSSLASAPTSKYLLSGMVEKLKGDPNADFGLVDVYGMLLAARLLVPRGELGVDARDFKLSNQRQSIRYGQTPMPIYTAVRHEIPDAEAVTGSNTANAEEAAKETAAKEAWFQWFERKRFPPSCDISLDLRSIVLLVLVENI